MGIHGYALVRADIITVTYPAEAPLLDDRARRNRGQRADDRTVELRGQLEPNTERRRDMGSVGAKETNQQVLILDVRDCAKKNYTPLTEAHRMTAIRWSATGITTSYNAYFDEVSFDASGQLYRIALSDRDPARRPR